LQTANTGDPPTRDSSPAGVNCPQGRAPFGSGTLAENTPGPIPVIEACLGHVSGRFSGIVGVYHKHDYEAEMQEAYDSLACHVLAITDC
jgi:hypothetical protein